MLLKKTYIFILTLFPFFVYAQQTAIAKDIILVSRPGIQIVIEGGIKFDGTTQWKDSGTILLLRDPSTSSSNWADNTAAGVLINNQGTTIFNDKLDQQELSGKATFYNLILRNKSTRIHWSHEIKNTLALDTGLLYFLTPTDSVYVSNTALGAITSTSSFTKSWIQGRLSRRAAINGPANEYIFPIGKFSGTDSLYAPVKIEKFNTNPAIYTAEYFPTIPFNNTNKLIPIDHISYVENWEVFGNIISGPDADAKLSLSWRGFSKVSANATERNDLIIAQYVNSGGFKWMATGGGVPAVVTGPDSLSGYVKHSLPAGFTYAERRFTLASKSVWNLLPVKLLYWTALAEGNKVRLSWNVEQEQDVAKYDIEKSTDGNNFSGLLSVVSLQKPSWLYTAYDYIPTPGWNFYRLRITDKSGSITYAGTRKIWYDKGLQMAIISPNPATDFVHIQIPAAYAGKVMLRLYSADGRLVDELNPATGSIRLNVKHFDAGTYLLKIITAREEKIFRFVKL
jgi:Secretion system C-terminal sorting domain